MGEKIERHKFKPEERRILVTTCFGHLMSHLNMLVFPAILLPLASRLGLSMGDTLSLSFWMYLLFGLTALPWGMAADRIGAKPLMMLFYAGSGLCALSAALWLDSPFALSLSLAGLGFFSGIYHPAGLGLISKEVERVSLGMGYNGMFGNLGVASAPLLAGALNWIWGIKAAYAAMGSLNMAGLLLMLILPLTERSQDKKPGAEENGGIAAAFFILLVAMMLGGIAYRGATVILPSYFELYTPKILEAASKLAGQPLSSNLVATAASSLIYLVGILGQYSGGRIADRYDPRISYLIFHSIVVPTAFLISLVSNLPLVLLALIYFFFLLGMQPIENTLVARLTPKRFHHSAFGTKFILTFGVGAVAVKILDFIETHNGIRATFPFLGIVSFALVITIVILIKKTSSLKQ